MTPRSFQHSQVMGHEVAFQAEQIRQLGRQSVGEVERINGGQPVRVAQTGVEAGSGI